MIPSPNIWNWPDVYARENRAQDADGALWQALAERVDWTGADVVDVGCGDGFHLPRFAERARSVTGVEPHGPLVQRARRRVRDLTGVRVLAGSAQGLPLPEASADLVHARTAYFFGRLRTRADRGRSGTAARGAVVILDLDRRHPPYGDWLCAAAPRYRPAAVEEFFTARGFDCARVDTVWRFECRTDLEAALRIEFPAEVAASAIAATPGLTVPVRYRVHVWRKPAGLLRGSR